MAIPTTAMAVLALAVLLGSHIHAASGAIVHSARAAGAIVPSSVSSNWSGYAVMSPSGTPISYSSITGTWTVPAVTCGAGDAGASSSIWVGIGGYSLTSQTLEQIGTDADCNAKEVPTYYAWYELFPADPVNLTAKVMPGNTITTSVNIVDATHVLLQVKNRTRDWTVTKEIQFAHSDTSSAEWITEAPCTDTGFECRVVPLANFGSVTIRKIAAIGDGLPGTLTNPDWSVAPLQLVPSASRHHRFIGAQRFGGFSGSTAGASPGAISTDGTAFSISWAANAVASTSTG